MKNRLGIALLLLCSNCVYAMNQYGLANAVAGNYPRDIKVVFFDVPCRYESAMKNIDGIDINCCYGVKILDNVEVALSELITDETSKSVRCLEVSYGMTSTAFKKLAVFNRVEYLRLNKCFLSDSDLSCIPSSVRFLDLSECMPMSGRLNTFNFSSLKSNRQLQFLSLAGTTLGLKDAEDLSSLESLKYVDLSYTNYTALKYKASFPDVAFDIIDDRGASDVYGGDIS